MTRLVRSRKGKTPIDVVVTRQQAGPRVRITVGDGPNKKNSDLDFTETENLILYLTYKLAVARGELADNE